MVEREGIRVSLVTAFHATPSFVFHCSSLHTEPTLIHRATSTQRFRARPRSILIGFPTSLTEQRFKHTGEMDRPGERNTRETTLPFVEIDPMTVLEMEPSKFRFARHANRHRLGSQCPARKEGVEGTTMTLPSITISINNPDEEPPPALKGHPGKHLILHFHDISQANSPSSQLAGFLPPEQQDVQHIIKFAEDMDSSSEVLCHCAAGISRSSAAALIIIASKLEPGTVSPSRPSSTPTPSWWGSPIGNSATMGS